MGVAVVMAKDARVPNVRYMSKQLAAQDGDDKEGGHACCGRRKKKR